MDKIISHFQRYFVAYLWLLVAATVFGRFYFFSVNISDSLPGRFYVVKKGALPKKLELAAFAYPGGGPYAKGTIFLKVVAGHAGDTVTTAPAGRGHTKFLVNGVQVGIAKPFSKGGLTLPLGPTGKIPEGRYYMAAPNPDSLDSRYAWVGWIPDSAIIGTATRIF